MAKPNLTTRPAKILEDPDQAGASSEESKDALASLVAWVTAHTSAWRDHRRSNYDSKWDEYERQWRGIWSAQDKNRVSERSKIVSPALSEAVENGISEIEEAVFGRGDFFDLRAEQADAPDLAAALEKNKVRFKEDLERSDFVANTSEALVNSGVFGTGIGELVLEERKHREIVPEFGKDGKATAAVQENETTYVCLKSVNPRNFLIDPNARTIDDALGVAIEERIGLHIIRQGIESGDYRDVKVEADSSDSELPADKQVITDYARDAATVLRYYGLVPRNLLFPPEQVEELFPGEEKSGPEEADESDMVEAIVVIASGMCLKAVESPYLMQDRPVVAFPWDVVPGRFWGRGICEKGSVPAKLLDAELRSRIDALAFSSAPMIAMDAARLPRGFKLEVMPGKTIPTAGDPSQVLKPFTFGQLDQNTWQQAASLDQMVQRATGSLDGISLAQRGAGGEARSGAVSMAMSGVAKRQKRTMMNFTDRFFIPALRKMLWRYMQFAPERYIPLNSSFVATSTTGIMQREYETQQLTQLLNTMQPGSREYKILLMGVIAHTGLNSRQRLLEMLEQSIRQEEQMAKMAQQAQMIGQPGADTPEAQMLQQLAPQLTVMKAQLELAKLEAETAELQAQAMLNRAKARQAMLQPDIEAREVALKGVYNTPEDQMQAEFDRRMAIADQITKQADIESNERIAQVQAAASVERERVKAAGNVASSKIGATPQPVPVPVPVPVRPPFM
jgi:hypothetical protein